MKKFLTGLLLALLFLFVFSGFTVAPGAEMANAQPADPVTAPDLPAFLQWLIGGGGSILAVSWLFERMKWFQALTPNDKDTVIFSAAVVVGCGAYAVVTYVPQDTLNIISPYFLIVASVFVTVFIAKAFHAYDKITG